MNTKSNRNKQNLLAAASFALLGMASASAADGVFSATGDLGGGDQDANVGLSSSKTYLNAVNTEGGAISINGVNFAASSGGNPSGTNYAITNVPNTLGSGGTNNVSGNLGNLLNGFIYGGNPETLTLNNLTAGQTYSLALYNRSWSGPGGRVQTITTTGGATTTFDQDFNAAGSLNILRYTFTATGTSEAINFANSGASFHIYGFATEQTFNNSWTSGSDWTTATFSGGSPNGVGSNADFTAQGSPTSINLDVNRTIGHIRFDGANAWTVSGANTLTLQADAGGTSVLGASSGSHTISTAVNLSNGLLKTGAGTVELSGALNAGSHSITLGKGTLVLSGDTTNIGNSGTIGFGGGNLKVAANTSTGRSLNFSNAGGIEVANGSTLTLTGGQWTGNGGFTKTGDGAMVVGSNFPGNDRFEIDSTRGGVFHMNAGSFTIASSTTYFVMGDDGQNATFNQTGGTFTSNVGEGLYVGNGSGGTSTMNITGGTFAHNGNRMRLGQGGTSTGILNIGGTASVTLPEINMGENSATSAGFLNLSGTGMLTVGKIGKGNGSGEITFDGGTLRASANQSTFMQGLNAATINAGGATIDSNGYAIIIGQGMGGTGGLTKTGSGTLTFSGANSYTGATVISAGTLSLAGSSSLPTTGAVSIASGATLSNDAPANTSFNIGAITLNGGTLAATATPASNLGNFHLKGDITVGGSSMSTISADIRVIQNDDRTFTVANVDGGNGVDLLVSGKLGHYNGSSWGYATKAGDGTMKLTGPVEIGGITVNAGKLVLEDSAAAWGTFESTNGGLKNNSQLEVIVTSDTRNLGVNSSGTGSMMKSGAGTLVLSGTNTYTGSTTVSAGTLVINGNNSAATGAVSVSNAGTRLKGNGTIGGDTTIHAGAIHSVGNSVGKQTFHDGTSTTLTYAEGSIFEWELGAALKDSNTEGAARGSDWDAVNVSGSLATTGTGAIFRVVLDGTTSFADTFWAQNRQWTDIFKTSDAGSLVSFQSVFTSFQHYNYSGAGNSLADLGNISAYGSFTIDGSSLNWTAVPELSNVLIGGLLGAGLLRRRRKN